MHLWHLDGIVSYPFFFFIHFLSIGSKVKCFQVVKIEVLEIIGSSPNRVFLNDFQVHPRCVSVSTLRVGRVDLSEPTSIGAPCRMDGMWIGNTFSSYFHLIVNHIIVNHIGQLCTNHLHLSTSYLPNNHQMPYLHTYLHRNHLHKLPAYLLPMILTYLYRQCEMKIVMKVGTL